MNILYASDDKFARILAVSIYSLLEHHKGQRISVYILDSGITSDKRKIINSLFKEKVHQIFWIMIDLNLEKKVGSDRNSNAQFSRLFFDKFVPKDVLRILYLDCDTFIVKNLSELYMTDFEEKVAILAKDPFSQAYRSLLNLPRKAEMYNSGIMLLNRGKYQQDCYDQRIQKVINKYGHKLIQGDQGILDVVFQGNVKIMDPRFNLISSYYEFSYSELKKYRHMVNFYSSSEIKEAQNNPVIIHFTSDFLNYRPWFMGSQHPYTQKWRKIEKKIWGNNLLISSNSKMGKLFRILPRKLSLQIFGQLQGYVRPWLYYLK